jgi:DHA3 family multidrug efflux protein-like MFS transporter
MLLVALSAMAFGTFVDRHLRATSMLLSSVVTLAAFAGATLVFAIAPPDAVRDIAQPAFWLLTALVLVGAIAGNLRTVALSTTVTLLVPEDRRDRANGLVGTANGIAFAITSVFSGLAIGFLGMGGSLVIAVVLTALVLLHLRTIHIPEEAPTPTEGSPRLIDARGAIRAVRAVSGLLALLLFSMFNNFLGGVFMALMDPYGLTLMSVEAWGALIAFTSLGFIVGGVLVTRRGLGRNPVRSLLLANVVMWTVTIAFPIRSEILPLALGFFVYLVLVPVAEASEQTVIQQVVPFEEQGRVFGLAQTLEAAAAPITAFLIGPVAQFWILPSMTDGALAEAIGGWFGTGTARGMALVFIVVGVIGLVVTLLALVSGPYRRLSARYADAVSRSARQRVDEAAAAS